MVIWLEEQNLQEGYEPNDAGVKQSQYNGSDQSWYIVLALSDQHI